MTFKERSKLALEKLLQQRPVTLDEARKQARRLKEKEGDSGYINHDCTGASSQEPTQ